MDLLYVGWNGAVSVEGRNMSEMLPQEGRMRKREVRQANRDLEELGAKLCGWKERNGWSISQPRPVIPLSALLCSKSHGPRFSPDSPPMQNNSIYVSLVFCCWTDFLLCTLAVCLQMTYVHVCCCILTSSDIIIRRTDRQIMLLLIYNILIIRYYNTMIPETYMSPVSRLQMLWPRPWPPSLQETPAGHRKIDRRDYRVLEWWGKTPTQGQQKSSTATYWMSMNNTAIVCINKHK